MNQEQLQKLVEDISVTTFKKRFVHSAYFNSRLRTTGGRYLLQSHNIEINKKYYDEQGVEELVGIIKHELCHYHLHLEKKGYQHKDPDFCQKPIEKGWGTKILYAVIICKTKEKSKDVSVSM